MIFEDQGTALQCILIGGKKNIEFQLFPIFFLYFSYLFPNSFLIILYVKKDFLRQKEINFTTGHDDRKPLSVFRVNHYAYGDNDAYGDWYFEQQE